MYEDKKLENRLNYYHTTNVDRSKEMHTNKKNLSNKNIQKKLKISHQLSYIFLSPLESFPLDYSWNKFWYVSYFMYHIYLCLYSSTRWKGWDQMKEDFKPTVLITCCNSSSFPRKSNFQLPKPCYYFHKAKNPRKIK